ncbi:MATE family efflux transporter [Gephyromycinifex aptenodytis]|uniref:oligosaccharide flippase family protein n=1 Tax=Gephyromycinifex aptenodytis TaxID=2716227 RepID=UPI00144548CD|nr:oligosaccharide flippase family protein [Gephyromycinifex aptenodytis]
MTEPIPPSGPGETTPTPQVPPPPGATRGSARTLVSGTSWSALSQFIPLFINLAMTPYIIHGLGASRYSIFLLISSFTLLLSQFDGGLGQSAMRYFTIYAGRDDRISTTRLLFSVSCVIVFFGATITLGVVAFSAGILRFFRLDEQFIPEASVLLVSLTGIVAFLLLRNLYNAVVTARNKFQVISMAVIAGHLTYAVGLVLTVQNGWGLYGVAGTMVIQQIVGTIITVPVGLRFLTRDGLRFIERDVAKDFLSYAWKVQIGGLATILTAQKDQLVAGRIVSAQQSGPFGQGTNFANQLKMVPLNALAPIQALIGSEVGAVGAAGARAKVEKLQYIWVVAVTGWCAVGIPATYVGVRAWLPESFSLTGDVAAILLVGHYFTLVHLVARTWVLVLGGASVFMRESIVMLATNVLFSVVLWFPFGIMGVVVGTSVGAFLGTVYFSFLARRVVQVRLRWFMRDVPYWQAGVAAAITAGIELLAQPHLHDGPIGLATAGLLGIPGALCYVLSTLGLTGVRDALALVKRR